MVIDATTFSDLSIFNDDDELSLFERFDQTRTVGGRNHLQRLFQQPQDTIPKILDTQRILKLMIRHESEWPATISNGSVMMVYKFYETAVDTIPLMPSLLSAYLYKLLHGPDFGLVKYSAEHAFNFLKAFNKILSIFSSDDCPASLATLLNRGRQIIDKPEFRVVYASDNFGDLRLTQILSLASFLRYHYKRSFYELIDIYSALDAWYGMGMAVKKYNLVFPEFTDSDEPVLEIRSLYHMLLPDPVPYDVALDKKKNFIFLTGANMAGKSTFIKSVGTALFLAHIGLGVPAESMKVSLFDGILTNINVRDNIIKGESFFYNEVRRIRDTIIKVSDGRKWLVLIDELFKGTNIQDAMKCSTVVIKGLVKIRKSLFVLSTHLYEISEDLREEENIDFQYFETEMHDDKLKFSYQLRNGVSNDRLGFFILQSENVIELLNSL